MAAPSVSSSFFAKSRSLTAMDSDVGPVGVSCAEFVLYWARERKQSATSAKTVCLGQLSVMVFCVEVKRTIKVGSEVCEGF
jgi:hypothetical protein